jgi:hypothetical protein
MEKTIQIGPAGEFGQRITITADQTIVTLRQSDSENVLTIPIMAWSDLNAVVVQLVAELKVKPIGANET